MGIFKSRQTKTLDKAIRTIDERVEFRIVGAHEGAKAYSSLTKAKADLPNIYRDNLYKWFKQVPLTIWKDTYVDGKRFPNRDIVETYSVDQLAKMIK